MTDNSEAHIRVRIFNVIFVVVTILAVAYAFEYYRLGNRLLFAFHLGAIPILLLSFLLVKFKKIISGKTVFLLTINFLTFSGTCQEGLPPGDALFYLCMAVGPFLLFEAQHIKRIYFLSLVPGVLYSVALVADLVVKFPQDINYQGLLTTFEISFYVAYVTLLISLGYFTYINDKYQKELSVVRGRLAHNMQISALGEMARGMAHEVNNPLSVIAGKIEIAQMEIDKSGVNEQKIRDHLRSMDKSVQRISQIIKSLSFFAKDINKEEPIIVNLRELILSTLDLCQQRFIKSNIEIRTAEMDSVECRCQPGQLQQAVYNILLNAFQAVQGQTEKWVEIKIAKTDSGCEISIIDSGPGVSSDMQDKIFMPFFTTKSIGQGRGLGLSSARGLIESQGGTLTLDGTSPNTKFLIRVAKA